MNQDKAIDYLKRYGITIAAYDDCKLFVPIGTIIKVRDKFAICKLAEHPYIDCGRCVGRLSIGQTEGFCATLMCSIEEREDCNEVFFEVIDNN